MWAPPGTLAGSASAPQDAGALLDQLKVAQAAELCSGGENGLRYLRLWPHLHQTDGFFAAVWERKA